MEKTTAKKASTKVEPKKTVAKKEPSVKEIKLIDKSVVEPTDNKIDNEDITKLKNDNEYLKEQIALLLQKMNVPDERDSEELSFPSPFTYTEEDSQTEYEELAYNKQVKIISLNYGILNLQKTYDGTGGDVLTFEKYGDIKTVMYSTLIDIVNANRSFAEQGRFYICNKSAIFHLGLNDYYKNILELKFLDGDLLKYSESDLKNIIEQCTETQKEVIFKNIRDKVYNGEDLNLNKIYTISKFIGKDIMSSVEEMKTYKENELLKKNSTS